MAIQKTSQEIKTLSGLKHIRLRYGMYIGSNANAYQLYREARDNANDEIINGFATDAWFTLHQDGSLSVRDNGRGMPIQLMQTQAGESVPMARAAVTVPNTGSHYEDQNSVSSGTNGVGSKAITALSDWMVLKIWKDNAYYEDLFKFDAETGEPGVPQNKLTKNGNYYKKEQDETNLPAETEFGYHGTEFRFLPSEDVFESTEFDFEVIVKDLQRIAYLNPQATYHVLNQTTGESAVLHEEGGLKAYVQTLIEQSEGSAITNIHEFTANLEIDDAQIKATIAMAWTNSSELVEIGFTNTLFNAHGGTHIDGFNQGISRLINNYAKNLNLAKETIEARDLRPGLVAVVNILHTDPVYSSQTKDQLTATSAKTALNKITYDNGQLEWDKYPSEVEAIVKQAILRAEERKKFNDLSKIKLDSKDMKAKVSKKLKPAKKLRGSKGVNQAEIFITEGDSASGSLFRGRANGDDGLYQAVFPLRGKVMNAMKATPDKVFANVELSTIAAALGAGIGAKYDESKLNYDKVIITTDPDEDGADIASLLRAFFFQYMPQLITNGHLYRASAPLFVNHLKNNKTVYTYNVTEQTEFLASNQDIVLNVDRNKGLGEMGDPMTRETLITPGTRRLYQFTTDDFDSAYETSRLFKGDDVAPRRAFLMENGEFANVEE